MATVGTPGPWNQPAVAMEDKIARAEMRQQNADRSVPKNLRRAVERRVGARK